MKQQQISWRGSVLRLIHFFTILSMILALVGTAPAAALAANSSASTEQAVQADIDAPASEAQAGPLAASTDVAALSPEVTQTITATIAPTPTLTETSGEGGLIQSTPEQDLSSGEIATNGQITPTATSGTESLVQATITPTSTVETQIPTLEKVTLVAQSGGQAEGLDGQVKVTIPDGAADEALAVTIRQPAVIPPNSPSGQPFEIIANGQVSKQEVHKFKQSLTIEVDYDPETLNQDPSFYRVVYYDTEKKYWRPLRTWADQKNHKLVATSDHLTVFDVGFGGWEATRLPGLQEFQVSQFTGAATYSFPIWTPPGPAGLQPKLELSYNSQTVDNAVALQTQASWVGMGWSLETGFIERNQNGTSNTGDDTFSISAGGVDSMILPGSDGNYHTADETFWRIQYDTGNDTWTAWDKNGTKYIFGDTDGTRARYPAQFTPVGGDCTNPYGAIIATWRWSLHKIVNIYGKELKFNYFTDTKWVNHPCDQSNYRFNTAVAVYPASIDYPSGHYQVLFDTEARYDYDTSLTDDDSASFFQKYRLKDIRILNDGVEVRRYDFIYESGAKIFPAFLWNAGGYTLTLKQVQESGLGLTLPANTFTYDSLHLTQAENGYGGIIQFSYDSMPWYEVEATIYKTYSKTGGCTYKNRVGYQPNLTAYHGGTATCNQNNGILTVTGQAYMPSGLLEPGSVYGVSLNVSMAGKADVGLDYGSGVITTSVTNPNGTISINAAMPGYGGLGWLHVNCHGTCNPSYPKIQLLTTRYRVIQKRIYDGINAAPQIFSYRYDEPATNDLTHSAGAATAHPYIPKDSEFRGHAMVQEIGPDGRVSTTFFHQDDGRKGLSSAAIVATEEFNDGFEQGWNSGSWTAASGSSPAVFRLRSDNALYLGGDSTERKVYRTGNSIGNGEAVVTQLMVIGNTVRGITAVETGTEGSGSYRRWGALAKPDPANPAQEMLVAQTVVGTTINEVATLIPSGTFKRETWYVVVLIVDDQKFFVRAWERDNPSVAGYYEAVFTSGQNWHFTFRVQNGQAFLDAYSEGRIYSLDYSMYTAVQQPSYPLPDGLAIWWQRLDQTVGFTFETGNKWLGILKKYSYDSYGNQTRETTSYWGGSNWTDYRATGNGYYPYTSSSVYLVGLPGYTNQYKCPAGSINGACLTANLTSDLITSSVWYLYDGHPLYSTPPTTGKQTGTRTQLRYAGANYTDPRYRDETYAYDAWGNRTSTTVYNSEGTYSALATTNPQTTSTTFDTAYNTFPLQETNALSQPTTFAYNYNLGLPTSMSGPNGSATTINVEYDGVGRLVKVIRPDNSSSSPTLQISYHDVNPFWVELTQRVDATLTVTARKYYNGLGQLVQDQTIGATLYQGVNPQDVITDYSYDAYGRQVKKSVPYAVATGSGYRNPQTQPYTQTTYDILGRTTYIQAPDPNSHTSFAYSITATAGQSQVVQTDALSHTTTTLSDSLGRVVQVSPHPGMGPSVSYQYDALDQLTQAARGGATTSLTYDQGGRKTQMTDPDMGTWSYDYDPLGNLKT
jgi:YD repeat-containing protein